MSQHNASACKAELSSLPRLMRGSPVLTSQCWTALLKGLCVLQFLMEALPQHQPDASFCLQRNAGRIARHADTTTLANDCGAVSIRKRFRQGPAIGRCHPYPEQMPSLSLILQRAGLRGSRSLEIRLWTSHASLADLPDASTGCHKQVQGPAPRVRHQKRSVDGSMGRLALADASVAEAAKQAQAPK